jgi:DNA primase
MAISQDDVVKVRQSTDIVEIVNGYTGLKKVGRRWMGRCPFHGEKTPSFSVNAEEGLFYCFGCQAKGDAITFVREAEHLDFVGAVEWLAGKLGIEIHYDNVAADRDRKHRKILIDAMDKAVNWYHERLLSSPDAAQARSYLRERGYDGDVVRKFKLGYAPDGWSTLVNALKLPAAVVRDTGLGYVNHSGRQQDAFRNRILFPIFDASGAPVAFGGRMLPGGREPKYKNSSETPIYLKSRTLYGLNWAKADVVTKNEVVVCEGYTDVIAFFEAGVPRAVATCGTALTEDHAHQLRNFSARVVLAYDADKAGQAAAERFYEWERKLNIEIVVADLPKGADPADVARRDPQRLQAAVANAKPFLGFRLDRMFATSNLGSPEGRAKAAEKAMAMIAEHPSELVRDQYVMDVAARCRVTADRLRSMTSGAQSSGATERVVDLRDQRRNQTTRGQWIEMEALQVAIQKPEDVGAELARIAPEVDFGELADVLFASAECQAAFVALTGSHTLHEAITNAEPEVAELLTRLAVEEDEAGVDAILRLVDRAASRAIKKLGVSMRAGEDISEIGTNVAWLKMAIERLREPTTAHAAAADVVSWLISRSNQATQEHSTAQ